MQDPKKLQEIENLGHTSESEDENIDAFWDEEENKAERTEGAWGGAPLLQAVLCAIAVVMLVFFKLNDQERYNDISKWYKQEMSQEIELPKISMPLEKSDSSPQPAPTESPKPLQSDSIPPQML